LFVSGRSEVSWPVPNEALLSSGSATSFMSKNNLPYTPQHQQLMATVRGPTVCTAAFFRPSAGVHYVRSNQSTDSYTAAATLTDVGYSAAQMSSSFVSNTVSQVLDTARNVDHGFGAVSLRSQPTHLRHEYIYDYSPMSATTSTMYEASGAEGASHMPAHGWNSATVPLNTGPRSHHIPSTSWQSMHRQADVELPATAGPVYSMTAPVTSSLSALQTSMQYSTVSSISSPGASNSSAIPSPVISPYSPSVGKTYSDASDGEGSHLPLHMQPQYLENLLQLQYLLLASNKLQASRYHPPSVAAQRFDTYIPGNVTPATRPTMFDMSHLSMSPGGFQHGYTAARFPRLVLNHIVMPLGLILVFRKVTVIIGGCYLHILLVVNFQCIVLLA